MRRKRLVPSHARIILSGSAKTMNAALAKHLWRSPAVRNALTKEAARFLLYIVVFVGAGALSRYIREKPIAEGVWSAAGGAAGIVAMWLVSVVRTVRAVLRENDLLGR